MSLLTGPALLMNGPQLTQLFADLRFTEKILRQNASIEGNSVFRRLFRHAPEEILTEILSQLDGFDLIRCQRVNRYFHTLIHESKLLQYKILLTKAHYKDGPRMQDEFLSTSAARASFLQTHIDGWRNLRNNSQALSLPLSACKDFAHGVLAWARGRVVHILELPSLLRQKTLQRRKFKIGFEPVKILVNPAQDLLALVECLEQKVPSTMRTKRTVVLHFKALSSGGPHPQAPHSIPFRVSTPNVHMRFFDNLLALAYKQPRTAMQPDSVRLEIVDWKQGQSLMKETLTPQDFVVAPFFLTRDLVLTCRAGILCDYLVIYDISSGAFKEIVSLTVGGVMKRGTTRHMTIEGSSPTETTLSSPFTVDDDSRAVHIVVNANERLWDNNDPAHTLLIDMTVPVHHFLCFAEAYKRLRRAGQIPGPVLLEKWTARNTVLHIYQGHVESTPMAVHGGRIVALLAGHTLAMEDVRPYMRHWVEKPSPEDAGLKWKVLFPPGIKPPNLKTWYRTQYIYRASRRIPYLGDHEKATEILMDEEHMIIIKTKNDEKKTSANSLVDLVIMSIKSQAD